jgi:hypothetical protein
MSSFKKRTDFFLTSKWVLLFVFVVSMGMLIGFAMARDMFGIVLFALIGFLTSFFSKNMIVILLISIGLTGVIAGMYPVEMRRIEGFGEDESFGQIEGFGEETDPDEEEEEEEDEENEDKKETKRPEKETKKPETKNPEKDKEKGKDKGKEKEEDREEENITKSKYKSLDITTPGSLNKEILKIYENTMKDLANSGRKIADKHKSPGVSPSTK